MRRSDCTHPAYFTCCPSWLFFRPCCLPVCYRDQQRLCTRASYWYNWIPGPLEVEVHFKKPLEPTTPLRPTLTALNFDCVQDDVTLDLDGPSAGMEANEADSPRHRSVTIGVTSLVRRLEQRLATHCWTQCRTMASLARCLVATLYGPGQMKGYKKLERVVQSFFLSLVLDSFQTVKNG